MISLGELSSLAHSLIEADREVEAQERKLKDAKETARLLREESIPSAMQELSITSFTLDTGEKMSIKQDVYAAIPVDRREEAYTWLESNGFGGIIKTEVDVHFSKGELERAVKLYEDLKAQGLSPEMERGVHVQTLKAFLREQLEAAKVNVPLDLFGARPVWTTKISTTK